MCVMDGRSRETAVTGDEVERLQALEASPDHQCGGVTVRNRAAADSGGEAVQESGERLRPSSRGRC
jgi:hypothetical protein